MKTYKIGDTVKVSKYHFGLKAGQGKFYKEQFVKKKIVDIDKDAFAVLHKNKYETVKIWYDKRKGL